MESGRGSGSDIAVELAVKRTDRVDITE